MGRWVQFLHFIFLNVGSIVASMPSFSFLKSVILTIPVGCVGGWGGVGWSDSFGVRLSFSPVQLKLSFV